MRAGGGINKVQDSQAASALAAKISSRQACVGVIGLGYVGLPLASAVTGAQFQVLGFDVNQNRVTRINGGHSPIGSVSDAKIAKMRDGNLFEATADFTRLRDADIILICVPTPLNIYREPDLSFVEDSARAIARSLRPGQLVILESTTYPGTTDEVMRPILEENGLRSGADFFLAYSPEREDPGNPQFNTSDIPKVVGGDGAAACDLACAFYECFVPGVVRVSSAATAEAVKLMENIFRSVNIALVNELKHVYASMGVDIWEVIDAAKTKPFGFMPFYPGPGLGGHCIPIDPFYLTWKAREYDVPTRFIELAGEINSRAPHLVVERLVRELSDRKGMGARGARILMLGVAYKKNVDDMRESPALVLMQQLERRGAQVDYYDPHVPTLSVTRAHRELAGRTSVAWDIAAFANYDAALICTDHDGVDYAALVDAVTLVIDTRNATAGVTENRDRIVRA
ncbi:MAG TPA: nucleotide sugar dehydrogenase [Alphaproteobacteria bacterium]|nr:nucleotide sugar dehydrogenase [Alphaproteobacteria bacterium]HBF97772.1 nucleotide sugar dehydrogenase [Alphaproteobacteria bacterium]